MADNRKHTRVVNIRKEAYDVYIGRAGKGQDGYFGNPFRLKQDMDRGGTLAGFREYFYRRLAKTRLPGRCGWWMRVDYLNNSVRRYGQVFVARGVIWWPSRWRRTATIHWRRHCVDGGSAG